MATVKAGFLEKLSGVLKREWKKRYFVLYQDGHLVYYDKPGSEHCNGTLNIIKNCQRVDYGNEVEYDLQQKSPGRVQCMFYIRSSVKNFCLRAENEQDARDWVQKLNKMCQMTITYVSTMNTYPSSQSYGVPPYSAPTYPPPIATPLGAHPGGMPQPYHVVYPSQPNSYSQPMPPQPPPMYYGQYPAYQSYPQQVGGYGYPMQQQAYQGGGRSHGGLSSRRGLLAGAAGGAVAGGLLGFGLGHAVGGFGDSFDDCDFD